MNLAPVAVSGRTIPPRVQRSVSQTLGRLREHYRVLAEVANVHGRNGYHVSLEVRDRLAAIDSDRSRLELFRERARFCGADASAVLADLGGEPDFSGFKVPPYVVQGSVTAF